MLIVGVVGLIVAVLVLLLTIWWLFQRRRVRWVFLSSMILLVVSGALLFFSRPAYRVVSVQASSDNPNGYVVTVTITNREISRMEDDALAIIQSVRDSHKNANAVLVQLYTPGEQVGSNQEMLTVTWAPSGVWPAASSANTQNSQYQTVFDYHHLH